ncbi:MAG: hypothetical protein HFF50_10640 [Lawsonibacter sp.]|nr:hypothetical protein [Lawsonibacter sp.]
MESNDYAKILDAMPGTGVYVIREIDHSLLYFNRRVQETSSEIRVGMPCHEVWGGSCENCPLLTIQDKQTSRSISYNPLFGGAVDITATRILWEEFVPAFVIAVSPRTEAGASGYRRILRADLNQDRLDMLKPEPELRLPRNSPEPLSFQLERFVQSGAIHPDDVDRFLSFTRPAHIQSALRDGRELACAYRRRAGEGFRWSLMEVVPGFDYTEEHQSAVFCIKDVHNALANLPAFQQARSPQEFQDRSYIIGSLSSLFFSTYYVDLEADTFRTVNQLNRVQNVLGSEVNGTAALRMYANNFVYPEDREEYLRVMSIQNWKDSLRWWQPCVAMEYRCLPESGTSSPEGCSWVRATAVLAHVGADELPKTVVYVAQDITQNKHTSPYAGQPASGAFEETRS